MATKETDYRWTFAAWAEAFAIFGKYQPDMAQIDAQHDVIFAGPDPAWISQEDKDKLGQLGWHISSEVDCFCRYT